MRRCLVKDLPIWKRGVDNGAGQSWKRRCKAATAHALLPVAAIVRVIPYLNRSVFEAGSINSM